MDLFVARQPIFDADYEIAGYELLYRPSAEVGHAASDDDHRMSSDVVVQSFLEMGLRRVTDGHPAFVNFGREMLLSHTYELFPPDSVVVELLERVEVDDEVVRACERLVSQGYVLALDDFERDRGHEPLLPLASIVKVDLLGRAPEETRALGEWLQGHDVRMLAERVETAEVVEAAREAGFTLFQGYYFSRPETVSHSGGEVEAGEIIPLMNLIDDREASEARIEERFRRNPSLSYKLLRMVSTAGAAGHGVESILHALRLLGRRTLNRWLGVLLASSLTGGGGPGRELVEATLVRARFLELAGERRGGAAGPLFMLGLFSTMDVLLQISMAELVERVRFTGELRESLLRRPEGAYLAWLELAEAYEAADWDAVYARAKAMDVDPSLLPDLYLEALEWATGTSRQVRSL